VGGGITGPEVRPCDGWVGEATAPSATGPDFPGRTLGSGFPTKAPAVILPRRYTRRCSGISPDTTAAGSNWILANTQPRQVVGEACSGGASGGASPSFSPMATGGTVQMSSTASSQTRLLARGFRSLRARFLAFLGCRFPSEATTTPHEENALAPHEGQRQRNRPSGLAVAHRQLQRQ